MATQRVKEYVDHGFGFPVVLQHVTLVRVAGQWTPRINYHRLSEEVLLRLSDLKSRLTGNQVRFIRQHYELTLMQFAARFGVSHVAVIKWEKSGNRLTSMSWSIEKDIRLFIREQLSTAPKDFLSFYSQLAAERTDQSAGIVLNAAKLAA